jgi:hypothetical protein
MATLAALLKSKGYDVRGSDQNVYPPMSDFLVQQGITLLHGYRPEHITADLDLVVVGNAISRGNPELEEVLDRKIRYCSLPEAVRDHFLWFGNLPKHSTIQIFSLSGDQVQSINFDGDNYHGESARGLYNPATEIGRTRRAFTAPA